MYMKIVWPIFPSVSPKQTTFVDGNSQSPMQ